VEQHLEHSVIREVMSEYLTGGTLGVLRRWHIRSKCLPSTKRPKDTNVKIHECMPNIVGLRTGTGDRCARKRPAYRAFLLQSGKEALCVGHHAFS
jgi:hypothetical protein